LKYNDVKWLVFGRDGHCNLEWYIAKALVRLGFNVRKVLFKEDLFTQYLFFKRTIIRKLLIREASNFKPDILLIFKGVYITQRDLETIRKKCGCLIVHLMNDEGDDNNFERYSLPIAEKSDIVFTAQESYIAKYKEHGISNVYHFTYACDPEIHRSVTLSGKDLLKYECEVSFAGTYRPERVEMIQAVAKFKPALWGSGWRFYRTSREVRRFLRGGALSMNELVKLYNASKITLNMHKPYEIYDGTKANMRVFEATASGVLLITDRPRGLEEMFNPGKELVCYDDLDDLPELVGYYLDNVEERDVIARRGQMRSRKDHTYIKRVQNIISKIPL
jgi:spore maturation protein CgeB